MACCTDDLTKDFPAEIIHCIPKDKFQSTIYRKNQYLGTETYLNDLATITFSVILTGQVEMGIFAWWWEDELDYGYEPFNLTIPIFGVEGTWEVKATGDLQESMPNSTTHEIKMTVELTDTAMTALDTALSGYTGGDILPCTVGAITDKNYKSTMRRKNRYLGGESYLNDVPMLDMEVMLFSDSDAETFASWWVSGINYGHDIITIEIPFFGASRAWSCKLTNNITEKIDANGIRRVKLVAELQEDVGPLLDSTVATLLCSTECSS